MSSNMSIVPMATAICIITAMSAAAMWDVYCIWTDRGDTVSAVVGDACRRWPVLALLAGILIGHLIW